MTILFSSSSPIIPKIPSAFSNMSLSNILCKTRNFQTWYQKCLICINLGCKFKTIITMFEISTLEFIKMKSFAQKKNLKFGPKKPFLSILDRNLKKLMSYLKSTPSNLSKYKKSNKTTAITVTTKNGTKNALFRYFVW